MDVTLWGEHCHVAGQELSTLRSENSHPVLAIKGARVAEFNGKTVGTTSKSIVIVNPDIPEKLKLTQWFEKEGFHTSSPSLTTRYPSSPNQVKKKRTLLEVQNILPSERAEWVSVQATITHIDPDNFYYLACPLLSDSKQCMKKLIKNSTNGWHCPKCEVDLSDCDYRYLLKLTLQDHTTSLESVVAFEDASTELLGIAAKDLHLLSSDPSAIREIFSKVECTQFLLTLSIKMETFKDKPQLKVLIMRSEHVDFVAANKLLLLQIAQMGQA